jgi:hypothetical protein
MPLTPYLQGGVFEPTQIEAMTTALAGVCRSLGLVDPEDPFIEIVAKKVIEIAAKGEHDSERIRELVLSDLNDRCKRSA